MTSGQHLGPGFGESPEALRRLGWEGVSGRGRGLGTEGGPGEDDQRPNVPRTESLMFW